MRSSEQSCFIQSWCLPTTVRNLWRGIKVSRLTIQGVPKLLSDVISDLRGSLGLTPSSPPFSFTFSLCPASDIDCLAKGTLETDWGGLIPVGSMEDLFCLGV